MKPDRQPTLAEQFAQLRTDQNHPSVFPLEQSRMFQLPVDQRTLSELPVDTSRLMRLPVDYSGLMRLPIDPNSAVEREFFGKRVVPEPEYIDEEPEAQPPRGRWGRSVAMLAGLAVVAMVGGAMAARSLRTSLPAAAAMVAVMPPPAAEAPTPRAPAAAPERPPADPSTAPTATALRDPSP